MLIHYLLCGVQYVHRSDGLVVHSMAKLFVDLAIINAELWGMWQSCPDLSENASDIVLGGRSLRLFYCPRRKTPR